MKSLKENLNGVALMILGLIDVVRYFRTNLDEAVLWMFTGISLIVEGVPDMITLIVGKKASEEDPA